MISVVLAAHGSRDPRAASTVREIAVAVAVARPDVTVYDAYLEFDAPHLATVLDALPSSSRIIVMPLLLSSAYHARTDIPSVVDATCQPAQVGVDGGRPAHVLGGSASVEIADVLGEDRRIIAALRSRLGVHGADGLILAAAGTRKTEALAAIEMTAARLGAAEGVPCVAAYASGAGRSFAEAVELLRSAGARRIAMASYFLAPGVLHDRVLASAAECGISSGSQPLGATEEIINIITSRIPALANHSSRPARIPS